MFVEITKQKKELFNSLTQSAKVFTIILWTLSKKMKDKKASSGTSNKTF